MPTPRPALLVALLAFASSIVATAAPLRIGIHDKPPYAIKKADGSWQGLSVTLWRNIAESTGIDYVFIDTPYEDLLANISNGSLDAAVGELSVHPTPLPDVEFSQPFMASAIGVAMADVPVAYAWSSIVHEFFNWTFGRVLAGLFLSLLIVSLLLWMIEHRHSHGHFHGGLKGLGSALWFSAVTMTTVGYGDKTPITFPGRILTFFWMLFGVLLVSTFTATVTSHMAAARLSTSISHIHDLNKFVCGTLKGSESERILREFGLRTVPFESLETALEQLASRRLQAVVSDKNSLRFLRKTLPPSDPPVNFQILDITARDTFLAIPIRAGLPESRKINRALVAFVNSPEWLMLQNDWLGSGGFIR